MDLTKTLIMLIALESLLIVPQLMYYLMMKREARKQWNIKVDENYRPKVTIIIPTYNESEVIEAKLRNLNELNYPENLLEVIIVDSASTDGTLDRCKKWLTSNSLRFKIMLLSEPQRISKSHALNYALKHANGEVIMISDADAVWEPNSILKSIQYIADPYVAAVCGKEVIIEPYKCVTSKLENTYRSIYYVLRLGESKLHSSHIFQGELAAYKRESLKNFVDEAGRADDNGTITEILGQGKRCIFVPEATFYDCMPCSIQEYLSIKVRRASQIQREFLIRLKLWITGKLKVPALPLVMNVYQHLVAPLLFIMLIPVTVIFCYTLYTYSSTTFYIMLLSTILILFTKTYIIISYIISNLALVIAILKLVVGRESKAWKPIRSSRRILREYLNN